MSAPAGNKNALKWTLEKTDEVLRQIESLSLSPANDFLTEALEYAGVYPEIWTYWQRIWAQEPDIIHRIKIVELRFHNKLLKAAIKGRIKAGIVQLLLRNNYGYASPREDKEARTVMVMPFVPPRLSEITPIEDIREVPALAPITIPRPEPEGPAPPPMQIIQSPDHEQQIE